MTDPFRLDGRTAVVTGAANGIGAAPALALATAGARVVLADRDGSRRSEVGAELSPAGHAVAAEQGDVARQSDVDRLARRTESDYGLDVWVNAAGILDRFLVTEADAARLDAVLDVNLKGTY